MKCCFFFSLKFLHCTMVSNPPWLSLYTSVWYSDQFAHNSKKYRKARPSFLFGNDYFVRGWKYIVYREKKGNRGFKIDFSSKKSQRPKDKLYASKVLDTITPSKRKRGDSSWRFIHQLTQDDLWQVYESAGSGFWNRSLVLEPHLKFLFAKSKEFVTVSAFPLVWSHFPIISCIQNFRHKRRSQKMFVQNVKYNHKIDGKNK